MERYIQVGEWIFELKQVRAIRASEFGQPYDASAYINIVDGVPHVEGLLTKHEKSFSSVDYLAFVRFFQLSGFSNFEYSQMKNGSRTMKEKVTND